MALVAASREKERVDTVVVDDSVYRASIRIM